MQKEREIAILIALFLQDLRDIRVSVARMDRQRQTRQPRRPNVCPEIRLLDVARCTIVKVVQP